jgi:hypothetical protein
MALEAILERVHTIPAGDSQLSWMFMNQVEMNGAVFLQPPSSYV